MTCFDRDTDSARLWAHFAKGRNVLMLAPRRIGKTVLLNRLRNESEANGYRAIVLDVQGFREEKAFFQQPPSPGWPPADSSPQRPVGFPPTRGTATERGFGASPRRYLLAAGAGARYRTAAARARRQSRRGFLLRSASSAGEKTPPAYRGGSALVPVGCSAPLHVTRRRPAADASFFTYAEQSTPQARAIAALPLWRFKTGGVCRQGRVLATIARSPDGYASHDTLLGELNRGEPVAPVNCAPTSTPLEADGYLVACDHAPHCHSFRMGLLRDWWLRYVVG